MCGAEFLEGRSCWFPSPGRPSPVPSTQWALTGYVVRGLMGCSVEFACHAGDHMLNVLVNSLFLLTGLQRSRAGLHLRAIFPLGAAACLPWQPMKGTH